MINNGAKITIISQLANFLISKLVKICHSLFVFHNYFLLLPHLKPNT